MPTRRLGRGCSTGVVFLVGLTLMGCSDDECRTEPAQACCDWVDFWVDACVQCSTSSMEQCEEEVRAAIDAASNDQGCEGADRIRNRDSFYEECLPELEMLECSELEAGNVPTACYDQILYQI